jgi:hypothetical protein
MSGLVDDQCLEDDCRQCPHHPTTRERHWRTVHAEDYFGRYRAQAVEVVA